MSNTNHPEQIWFNGKLMPWQDATVHVMSHALHYGSSVFEGIRAYNTPKGTIIFRLTEHIERLFNSAKIYQMDIPFTQEEIITACKDAIKANNLGDAYLRPLAFYGDIGMGLRPPLDAKSDVMIAAFFWGAYLGDEAREKGVDVGVSSWNRLAPNTMPTAAKAGGNYLSSQLISMEARRHGYTEGIALDVNNYVSEGAGQNLFLVRKGVIYTPPTTASILSGLTRDTVITLARELGYEVREELISRESLYVADEFFMCGTASEIVAVRSVDGIEVGSGKMGDITRQLQDKFFGLFNGETEDTHGWLESID
ncbi:branched-chain amino acid transaminase [Psychrobium sp. 1_MG-2023]|uniref:branched-chain amino acid transaminase n=1 Tax=Psychrobium sp. 1_MG-2023 TaxID=3062624 RepID=UPI000C334CA4|nr:branched-chain amino acid transaminase [Psychrobium sp. 1_MG-2023]MDP2562620.1 branched-chain amino acid transaminase [Psychrobium sp. 1_MG-2023]PKF54377.1 branched chain amino acid aminotransferase [Alteromonadales bacterium alter-6D02]